ncbi:MAG: hypothetical protein KDB18_11200, partial [Salinibacterium sp.]|nr:hypothetical protein [Salinibacterium sp.]
TPINMGCMVVRLHEATSWRSIWFQNDAEENRSRQLIQTDDGAEEKVFEGVLWPERYTAETLLSKKKMLEQFGQLSGYYREWEAKAVGAEDQSFQPQMFKYWFGKLMFDAADKPYLRITHRSDEDSQVAKELDPPELVPVETYVGIDPAASVSETADFTVICPIAVDSERNIYVLPYVRGRYQTFDLIERIRNVHRGVKPRRGLIETTSAQVHLAAFLRESGIRYMEDKPVQRKVGEDSRIGGIQYLFATGKVFIQREMTQLYLELVQYPRARKDDTGDALEKAIRIAGRGRPWHGISSEKDVEKKEKKRKVLDWMLS